MYLQNYQAENLVKSDGYKKWKIVKGGEKSGSVTLQVSSDHVIAFKKINNFTKKHKFITSI